MNWLGRIALLAFFLFFVALLVVISFPEKFNHTVPEAMLQQSPAVRVLNTVSLLAVPFMLAFGGFLLFLARRSKARD